MPLPQPLNNNVLIETQRDYADVSRDGVDETLQEGILINHSVSAYHLTASTAIRFDSDWVEGVCKKLDTFIGKKVRWEQYAEGGQTFEQDGKTYALIPWWRLISVEGE